MLQQYRVFALKDQFGEVLIATFTRRDDAELFILTKANAENDSVCAFEIH